MGSIPGLGKILLAAEQISPCATPTEPSHLGAVLHNKGGAHALKPRVALVATRESPCALTKTQCSQKTEESCGATTVWL